MVCTASARTNCAGLGAAELCRGSVVVPSYLGVDARNRTFGLHRARPPAE